MPELLVVDDLHLEAGPETAPIALVRGVSFSVGRGEALGLVGESGAGKSLTAAALPFLLPAGVRQTAGHVWLDGQDVSTCSANTLRSIRGRRIGFVGQDPVSALDPTMMVLDQVAEAARAHPDPLFGERVPSWARARERALETLDEVGLPELRSRPRVYPHELSGGQRQRAVLAMALVAGPELLVADEPTSALDVTLEAQFLALLAELRRTRRLALVLISHDLALVAALCERLLVFQSGRVVEAGPRDQVLLAPRHPYTRSLLAAARGDEPASDRTGEGA